ncbi:FAD-dependent oxidoreductase [Homoserinibacter sp. GY 40078]|uniref:FAD-dependent oxidoreductase n=1 Tax=Homoserinibacter sp. GY 40078 TaxID=2603275 RepID=UPI0011C9CD38|nr:FAD-dependent oxidoreductase [Homoserinibacter sp. GY 40078]TXK18741.1 FAD-dependent oxidoreductase [Homoserinibacter sp. GY 40078]
MPAPIVVVGAGLAGSATAWRLAQQGREVVLVEAVRPAHAGGSSHGSARIFRHAYPDRMYAELTVRALAGWRELEAASGRGVLTTTGGLDFGAHRPVDEMARVLDEVGLESEILDPDAARERWPHLAFDTRVLTQPDAGVIDAETAVREMTRLAVESGARLETGWRLASVEDTRTGLRLVSTDGGVLDASVVVVAAGGWLPELLDALPLPDAARAALPEFRVSQQQAFHFRFPDAAPADPADWPIFVDKGRLSVYSLPGGRDADWAGFKIAEHDGGHDTTASGRDGLVDPAARERIVGYVRERLPEIDPTPYAETTCLYTSTPSEDFVIDRVGRIVLASPCSGHGAKFAPLLGELIGGLATGDGDVPDRFRLTAGASAG